MRRLRVFPQQRRGFVLECKYRRPDKVERWIRIFLKLDEQGESGVWMGLCTDITDAKKRERDNLKEAKRQTIERLAGGIAHDLNNYLGSILLGTESLAARLPEDEASEKQLGALIDEIHGAITVAKQLLAFTKDHPVRMENVSLLNLLQDTSTFALRGSSVTVELEGVRADLTIPTDRGMLQQVFFNLILNAREAMHDRGRIRIRVEEHWAGQPAHPAKEIIIHLMDEGPGIAADRREQIFEPYVTEKARGTGLGLFVTRTLLQKLKGSVRAVEPEGVGAHFVVTLPAHLEGGGHVLADGDETRQGASHQLCPYQEESRTGKIFLLEDTQALADLIVAAIGQCGVEVEHFIRGELLLERARIERADADLVFMLDVTVRGGKGGLDIVEELRDLHPESRIILTSGYSDRWTLWKEKFGSLRVEFLSKPFGLDQLMKLLSLDVSLNPKG